VPQAQANLSSPMRGLEPFPEYSVLKPSVEVEMPVQRDRRRRLRADVRWAVSIRRHSSRTPIESITDNLSSEGFYCVCDEPFFPGEFLECMILAPTHTRNGLRECLGLRCLVQVVRVESLAASGRCAIGCHIEDYRVVPSELARRD
jgi:hypothetical protein